MNIVALVLPLVVIVTLVVAAVVLRREFRRRIWSNEGERPHRGGRRR